MDLFLIGGKTLVFCVTFHIRALSILQERKEMQFERTIGMWQKKYCTLAFFPKQLSELSYL